MFAKRLFGSRDRVVSLLLCGAALGLWAAPRQALAQTGHDHGAHGDRSRQSGAAAEPGSPPPARDLNLQRTPLRPPHGGQVTATGWHYFEVVYQPQETRIYVYSPSRRPLSARSITGWVLMQVRGNPRVYRFPVKPVDGSVLSNDPGYLSVAADVSRVRDGDMEVVFELNNLPQPEERSVRFQQTFALTRAAPQVRVVALTDADRAAIARQRVCPVSGGPLGGMGQPIKLLVGDTPLFLCCRGCIAKVQQNPQRYLQRAAQGAARPAAAPAAPRRPQVAVAEATAADAAAIRAQGYCPVTNQPLGAHGRPVKVLVDGRPLFLCCKGCLYKVQQDPLAWLAKADQLRARK